MNTGTKTNASDFNALFARLEAIRQQHYSASAQTTAGKNALKNAFTTSVVATGDKELTSNVQQLKNDLSVLANSTWIDSTFAAKIVIPSSGDLIQAVNFNLWDSTISEVEGICAHGYSQSYSDSYSQSYYDTYFNSYDH